MICHFTRIATVIANHAVLCLTHMAEVFTRIRSWLVHLATRTGWVLNFHSFFLTTVLLHQEQLTYLKILALHCHRGHYAGQQSEILEKAFPTLLFQFLDYKMVLIPPVSLWSPWSGADKEGTIRTACYFSQHELYSFNQRKILKWGDHFPCFRLREIMVRVQGRKT